MKIDPWPACILAVAVTLTTGCEPPRYDVAGQIIYADGSPFTATGFVVAEGDADGTSVMARSIIGPDGRFLLTGRNEHEGMLAGRYRLRLVPPRGVGERSIDEPSSPQLPFDRRFLEFETSGLTYDVGSDSGEVRIDLGPKPAGSSQPLR